MSLTCVIWYVEGYLTAELGWRCDTRCRMCCCREDSGIRSETKAKTKGGFLFSPLPLGLQGSPRNVSYQPIWVCARQLYCMSQQPNPHSHRGLQQTEGYSSQDIFILFYLVSIGMWKPTGWGESREDSVLAVREHKLEKSRSIKTLKWFYLCKLLVFVWSLSSPLTLPFLSLHI